MPVLFADSIENYFRLPSQETLTLVTAGSTEVSLETVMVPSNMPFTRAA